MTTRDYEHISALMDEEIAAHKEREVAVSTLLDDADAQRAWYEYHLIRDCLQNHQTELGYDVSPALKARLTQEQSLHVSKRMPVPANQVFKGFAVAASIAAVMIAVWQVMPTDPTPAALTALDNVPIHTTAAPLMFSAGHESLKNQQTLPAQSIAPDSITVALDDPYLEAHQRAMTTDGLMRVSASFDGVQ